MRILKTLKISFLSFTLVAVSFASASLSENYIKRLDAIRNAMIDQGNKMPDIIRKSDSKNLRTLERIYELNTSALTTIEAYFRMLKIALSSQSTVTKDTVNSLNQWLDFIHNQCKYDIDYLDEALSQTEEPNVISQIETAKNNIRALREATHLAITENKNLLK